MLLEGPDPNKRWNEGMESSDSRSELRTDADINCCQIVDLYWGSRTKHITSGLHVFTHVWRRFSPGTAVWLDRKIPTYKIQCFPGETRRAESMMITDVSPHMFWWWTWVRNQSHLPDNQSIFQSKKREDPCEPCSPERSVSLSAGLNLHMWFEHTLISSTLSVFCVGGPLVLLE